MGHCFTMARTLAKGFLDGEFDEVYVVYTNFVSMLTQTPAVLRLLPLNAPKRTEPGPHQLILYEPDCESVYNAIVPEYLAGLVYGALCESVASEWRAAHRHGRRQQERRRDDRHPEPALQPGPPGRHHTGDHRDRGGRRSVRLAAG